MSESVYIDRSPGHCSPRGPSFPLVARLHAHAAHPLSKDIAGSIAQSKSSTTDFLTQRMLSLRPFDHLQEAQISVGYGP